MKTMIPYTFALLFGCASASAGDSLQTHLSTQVASYARSIRPATAAQAAVFDPALKPFYHGVASGDPLSDRVILWTRVTPDVDGPVEVQWRIATDTALTAIVNSGSMTTDATHDYTVKIDATGLQPGTTYYYGFTALGRHSLTGRTRTAPTGTVEHLRFAVASCSNYQQGYFNAYATMAARNDLDAVLFLGDYIYEYPEGGYGYSDEVGRGHEPKNETITLDDYRIRHSFYKLDPDLRRVHQQFPFIAVWDDHESTNDSYRDGAQNHQDDEGDWSARKNNSRQAYFEWMPVRTPDSEHPQRIYRSLSYGTLMDLVMIDTRLEGRDKQLDSLKGPALLDTTRSLMGKEQFAWFLSTLKQSQARWKIVGNQVMVAQVGGFANADAWDGYPMERDKMLAAFEAENIRNVVFVTGDIHSSWAGDLSRNPTDASVYNPSTGEGSLAVEFVTPSISSANLNEITNQPPRNDESRNTEALLAMFNRHLKFIELDSHGYLVLDIDNNRVQSDWFFADTILAEQKTEHYATGLAVQHNTQRLVPATAPAPDKEAMHPAPLHPPASATSVQDHAAAMILVGTYPNPCTAYTLVHYALNRTAPLRISVHDMQGRTVAVLVDGVQQPGTYSARLDASALAAGTYLCRMECNGAILTRTIVKQ